MAQRDCSSRATGRKAALSSWARASGAARPRSTRSRDLVVLRTLIDPVTDDGDLRILQRGERGLWHPRAAAAGRREAGTAGCAATGALDARFVVRELADQVAGRALSRIDPFESRRLAARHVDQIHVGL